jgi:hypothetical protein
MPASPDSGISETRAIQNDSARNEFHSTLNEKNAAINEKPSGPNQIHSTMNEKDSTLNEIRSPLIENRSKRAEKRISPQEPGLQGLDSARRPLPVPVGAEVTRLGFRRDCARATGG